MLGATVGAGQKLTHRLGTGRQAYLVAATGRLTVNGVEVAARDGVVVRDEPEMVIEALDDSELLLVDLPAT